MKKWGKNKILISILGSAVAASVLGFLIGYTFYDNCAFSSSCNRIDESYLKILLSREKEYRENNVISYDTVDSFSYREQLNDVVTEADKNHTYFTTYFEVYQSSEYIESINGYISSINYKKNDCYSFSASRCCSFNRFSFKYEMDEKDSTSIGILYLEATFEKHYLTNLHIENKSENITVKTDLSITLR